MDDTRHASLLEYLVKATRTRIDDEVSNSLGELLTVSSEDRKRASRELRNLVNDRPTAFESFMLVVTSFLIDDERAVRLLTAKALTVVVEADSDAVAPAVSASAECPADEDEFCHVRVRPAETLGYVVFDHPGAVASPVVLADLHVGFSSDEPEMEQKLVKMLKCVVPGGPGRFRHRVLAPTEHLDDRDKPIWYRLYTAIVGAGCDSLGSLTAARGALSTRFVDESAFVWDCAAEALELLAGERDGRRDRGESVTVPDSAFGAEFDEAVTSVAERVRFLRVLMEGGTAAAASVVKGVGILVGVRRTTVSAVIEIMSSDAEGVCPHCGIDPARGAPSMCSSCDAPY